MSSLDGLLSRRSVPAQFLGDPGPAEEEIQEALATALHAPDHGRIQPWRLRLIRGAARARFAELLVRAALVRDPQLPAPQLEKLRSRPLQAPLVIAIGARLRADPKVPEIEQLLAAGAGAMNLLNAFHLQGYGAIWLTGPSAYDPTVAAALGYGSEERLLGFLYAGSIAARTPAPTSRVAPAGFVSEWVG